MRRRSGEGKLDSRTRRGCPWKIGKGRFNLCLSISGCIYIDDFPIRREAERNLEKYCTRFAEQMWQVCGAIVMPVWAMNHVEQGPLIGMKDHAPSMLELHESEAHLNHKKFQDLYPGEFRSFMEAWSEYSGPYLSMYSRLGN